MGLRTSYDWKLGGVIIKSEVRAAWQHEYGDKSYDISASFADGGGDHFLVNGPEIGRDSLLVGAGFAIQFSESCSTYFYYDGELGRDRHDRNSVTGGVRVSFQWGVASAFRLHASGSKAASLLQLACRNER